MKNIRAYGTPEKKKKKRDEAMVYICNNKPNEVFYVESYQASFKENDKKIGPLVKMLKTLDDKGLLEECIPYYIDI